MWPGWGESAEHRARALIDAWRIVVRRAKAKYGYDRIPYLAVVESTKKGEPHLHILARVKWIDWQWLSDQMRALIAAPGVDIRAIYSRNQIANYVAKYIGKEPHHFGTCKRYWATRDFEVEQRPEKQTEGTWSTDYYLSRKSVSQLEAIWRSNGWLVSKEGEWLVATITAPPQIRGCYVNKR